MTKTVLYAAAFAIIVGLTIGCDTQQKIPAYLYIPAINVQTDPNTQGTDNAKIIDAWVYANDNLVAGVRLPATVPIIADGNTKITIQGGIAENGSLATPATYPLFANWERNMPLVPGKIDTVKPVMSYRNDVVFALLENFGNGNNFETIGTSENFTLVAENAPFNAPYMGKITLDATHPNFSAGTIGRYTLSKTNTWLELNYRNPNNEFSVGIIGYRNGTPLAAYQKKVYISPKSEWSKIYISFSKEIAALDAETYQIVISADKETSASLAEIFIDNIKVLRF